MITIISGTNRPQSQSLRVAQIFQKLYQKEGVETQLLDLQKLPVALFTPDAYAHKPAEFEPFSQAVLKSKGLVVVTPEYNGGFPGVLKLFIDMLKFPESFEKRPVAFVGVAAGMWGALRPVEQLEAVFKYRNAFLFNERIFLPKVESQIKDDGSFATPLVAQLAEAQVKGFIKFTQAVGV